MTEEALSTDLTPAEAPEVSTQLDNGRPTDPAQSEHKEAKEEKKPESRLDAIKRAAEDVEKANDKADDKGDDKKEVAPKEKEPEPKEETPKEQQPKEARKDGERRHPEPPKHFSPSAREKWLNVPYDVKVEIERTAKDHEAAISSYKEAHERYEGIRQYDEIARSNGRDLKESLARVHHIENLMQSNPLAGLNAILQEVGPRKPDGQAISLYEVAQHIVQQGPQGYQQMMAQANQPQSRQESEVEQLRQQMMAMQQQMTVMPVIEKFQAEHPRYSELEDDIVFFLESGRIPTNLSHYDRLSQAYDMAVRINPTSQVMSEGLDTGDDVDSRAGSDFGGNKSVKGAPASGVDVSARRKSKMSRSEAIQAAMSELGIN